MNNKDLESQIEVLQEDLKHHNRIRDLIIKATSFLIGDTQNPEVIKLKKAIDNPADFCFHPTATIHLFQAGDDYLCESAIVVFEDKTVEHFEFTPPIKTSMRLREMSTITLLHSEFEDQYGECMLLSFFHKGCTYFGLATDR
jgi:hypothetical protein